MTEVVLVGIETEENLAIRYLAAACERAGLRTTLVTAREHGELENLVANVVALRPRVVGLAMTFQCYARPFLHFAERLRANGFDGHLTAGGHFATLAAERLLRDAPALDSIVMHEGEATLVELTRRLVDPKPDAQTLQSIRGLAFRDGDGSIVVTAPRALGPLDDLAPPLRADPAPQHLGIGHATLVGSRGCYGSCTYCSIQAWYRTASGPRFRQRSIDDIVAEMRSLYGRGVRIFNFHDDNFFVPSREDNVARLDALIDAVRNAGMADAAVVMKCRPNDIDGPILDRLETLRVLRAYVGIETASPEGVRALGRGVQSEKIGVAIEELRERSIFHAFNMLLFDPDTTLESIVPNLDLLEHYEDVPFNFCRAEVYVETPLEKRLMREGRLAGTYFARSYEMNDPRAELMFRIVSTAFNRRNFAEDGLAMLNLEMRFDLEILRRFYPTAWDRAFHARAVALSGEVGRSSVRYLRDIHTFVRHVGLQDNEAIRTYAVDTARAIHRDDFLLFGKMRALNGELASRVGGQSWRPREEN
jgi:radical SAM superfamily enzyme YgiQ (UPF0313 family)